MTVSVLTQDPNNKINVKKKKRGGGGGREVWVGVVGGRVVVILTVFVRKKTQHANILGRSLF